MNPSFIIAFGMLLLATVGQSLVCTSWVHKSQTLVYTGPSGTCYAPEIHISGDNWRLCCDRFSTRSLGVPQPVEPLLPETSGARTFRKCTRWMPSAMSSRVALARDACTTSLVSESKDGEMRICCV